MIAPDLTLSIKKGNGFEVRAMRSLVSCLFVCAILLAGAALSSAATTNTQQSSPALPPTQIEGPIQGQDPDADQPPPDIGFYDRYKEGYYWGHDPKAEKKKEVKEEPPPKPAGRKYPSMKDYTMRQLWDMHPDDFSALLTEFQKKAIMTLNPEDTREYLLIQDISRRKAMAFANVTQYVTQVHPELSANRDVPDSWPGKNAKTRMEVASIKDQIYKGQNDYGLIYFFKPDCAYCKSEDGILYMYIEKYHWEIQTIDVDANPGLAQVFNVETTPTVVLVYRENAKQYIPVSVGVATLSDLEVNIMRGMKILSGEITPEQWSVYEFERGGSLDPTAPLEKEARQKEKKNRQNGQTGN